MKEKRIHLESGTVNAEADQYLSLQNDFVQNHFKTCTTNVIKFF